MRYGEVFNSFDELYNAKPFQSYPIGADRFEAYVRQSEKNDGWDDVDEGLNKLFSDDNPKGAMRDFGSAAKKYGKAVGTLLHGNLAGREAGKAIRSGLDAAREYKRGNKRGAVNRLGSSLAHTGKAAMRTAQIPLEAGKTMASRFAWSPDYNIEKFYREHTNLRD